MAKLNFKIITPERVVLSEQLDALTCPTTSGQITVLPGHVPLISSLEHGELVARIGGKPHYYAVSGGFIEVRPANEVVILADTAEHADEIDQTRAEEAKTRAEESMKKAEKMSAEEYAQFAGVLQRNLVRLRVAKRSGRTVRRGQAVLDESK